MSKTRPRRPKASSGFHVRRPLMKNRKRQAKRKVRNGCSGKRRYIDQDEAIEGAKRILIKEGLGKAYVYLCDHGPHYHVSSREGPSLTLFELEVE